jgi:hypothetical protein
MIEVAEKSETGLSKAQFLLQQRVLGGKKIYHYFSATRAGRG